MKIACEEDLAEQQVHQRHPTPIPEQESVDDKADNGIDDRVLGDSFFLIPRNQVLVSKYRECKAIRFKAAKQQRSEEV